MADDCIAGFCRLQCRRPTMRWHCRTITALCPAQLTKKIGFSALRQEQRTGQRVVNWLKWDEGNGSAENVRLKGHWLLSLRTLHSSCMILLPQKQANYSELRAVDTQTLLWEMRKAWKPNLERHTDGRNTAKFRQATEPFAVPITGTIFDDCSICAVDN